MKNRAVLFLLFTVVAAFAAPSFTVQPSLSKDGPGAWHVDFTVSESTDVAVTILKNGGNFPVRHLAAGMLGANAPAPLTAGSLAQRISWDGTDDQGNPVADTVSLAVRVQAGMSVRLVNMVGDNPDIFSITISGLAADESNRLYIAGPSNKLRRNSGQACVALRAYDSAGRYIRTLYPYSAELPKDSVRAHGLIEAADGSFAPKIKSVEIPVFSSSLLPGIGIGLVASPVPGTLMAFKNGAMQTIRTSGGLDPVAPIMSFKPAAYGYCLGTDFVSVAANPRYLYFSGRFRGLPQSGWQQMGAQDTGFWRDGTVYKVDRETGDVTQWLRMETIPATPALRDTFIGRDVAYSIFHGTASDDSGHVYVCDRHMKRVGVYDTLANLVGSIPRLFPDNVLRDARTGALYVTTRWRNVFNPSPSVYNEGAVWLYKYDTWRGTPAPVCSVRITNVLNRYGDRTHLAVTRVNGKPVVWAAYGPIGVMGFTDEGAGFVPFKTFPNIASYGFGHLDIDRQKETAFFTNNAGDFFKISDWNNPAVTACSTSDRKPLLAVDMVVSPDRYLYAKTARATNEYWGPFRRFTLDYYHGSAPFANTGKDTCIRSVLSRYDALTGEKGFAVSRQGKVGAIYFRGTGRSQYYAMEYNATGGQDSTAAVEILGAATPQVGGIRYDRDGNVYVGFRTYAPDRFLELPYASDKMYTYCVGSVVKYPAGRYGFQPVYTSGVAATPGALKVYPADLSPLPGGLGDCACRTPRFDVDPFGRLFIPSSVTQKVTVLDNNGNRILRFGQYGNRDSRGGLPGGLIATPSIPLAWPTDVAASDEHVFVTDIVNCRIVRLKMEYALDNMPGAAVERKDLFASVFATALFAAPNPFGASGRVSVSLAQPGLARLTVHDAAGRLVKTLWEGHSPAGVREFSWNGTGASGAAMASGVYFFRLSADGKVLHRRAVLAR